MVPRILIAQTDTRLRRLYQGLLTWFGHDVAVARCEAECIVALRVSPPDLLLLDQWCCPEDGSDLLAALCGGAPVVVTVQAGVRVNWCLLTAPEVVDVFYTPAAPSEVLECVRAALAGEVRIRQKLNVTRGNSWAVYSLHPLTDAAPRPPTSRTCGGLPVRTGFNRTGWSPIDCVATPSSRHPFGDQGVGHGKAARSHGCHSRTEYESTDRRSP